MENGEAAVRALELLRERRALFEEFEVVTRNMLNADNDEIVAGVEKRARLAEKIDEAGAELDSVAGGGLKEILHARACEGELSGVYQAIEDETRGIREIIRRVRCIEPDITQKMNGLRNELKDKIREVNLGEAAKVARYVDNVTKNAGYAPPPRWNGFGKA